MFTISSLERLVERDHQGDTDIDERIIQWIVEKCGVRMLKQLRIDCVSKGGGDHVCPLIREFSFFLKYFLCSQHLLKYTSTLKEIFEELLGFNERQSEANGTMVNVQKPQK
jgi:hypothetical protein